MKKKCLLVGGAGFIGRNVASYLYNKGYKIKIIDKYLDKLVTDDSFPKEIELGQVDINDTSAVIEQMGDYENILWLVHTTVPSNSMMDMSADFISNISPLINFITRIRSNPNVEKIVYLSSGGTVYGDVEENVPIQEDAKIDPISNYGLTKYIAEKYIKLILDATNLSAYILRPSNVYGAYQNLNKPQGIVGHAFKAALNSRPMFLYNNGEIIRDFIHVEDLASAIYECFDSVSSTASINTYNIGSGEAIFMKDIIKHVNAVTGKEIEIVNKPQRAFDCNYNVLDNSLFKKDFNWAPKVDISDGLKSVWDWIRCEPSK